MRKLTVNVNIEEITLPMTVSNTEDEEIYRKAASQVNERLRTMRQRYPDLPQEKYYYAMVMLNTAVDALRTERGKDISPVMSVISELERDIDNLVK